MPHLVLTPRQCELAYEAIMCLRTSRLQRDPPDTFDATELEALADYVQKRMQADPRPGPEPSPGRRVE